MIKRSYSTMMSYNVSAEEKKQAEKAMLAFTYCAKQLKPAATHLDIIKTPFKDNPDIPVEDIMKARAALRRFRDKAIENFNNFKKSAFYCVDIMQIFSSDTQTVKIMKSFISSIDELEEKVNSFIDLFNDLESKDFTKNVVSIAEDIQKQCTQIEEIIEDRVKSHIQSNILAKSWVDTVSNELKVNLKKKVPLLIDLYNKRLDDMKEINKQKI